VSDTTVPGPADPERDAQRRQAADALEAITCVSSLQDLEALLADRPELLQDPIGAELVHVKRELPETLAFWQSASRVLEVARGDKAAAWAHVQQRNSDYERAGETLVELDRLTDEAEQAWDLYEAVRLVRVARDVAGTVGNGLAAAVLYVREADLLCAIQDEDREQHLEDAIWALDNALRLASEAEQAAQIFTRLGMAFGDRIAGDRADNRDAAVFCFRNALEILADAEPRDVAFAQHNVAVGILRLERGEPKERYRDVLDLSRAALTYRRLDREPGDWAHSQLNVGFALEGLWLTGEPTLEESIDQLQRIIDAQGRVPDWLVAEALHAVGRMRRRQADVLVEDIDVNEVAEQAQYARRREILQAALPLLREAKRLGASRDDRMFRGRIDAELATVAEGLELWDEAYNAARAGAAALTPRFAPVECVSCARRLGQLAARHGDWDVAARAYGDAMAAANFNFHSRTEPGSRAAEAGVAERLGRWAGYALARAGDGVGAVLAIEDGASRELRGLVRMHERDVPRLDDLPAELREAYEDAVAQMREPQSRDQREIREVAYQRVLADIRVVPGWQMFAAQTQTSELAAAIEPGWPLMYVNPTADGTLLALVDAPAGEPRVQCRFLDRPSSLDVFLHLMAGTEGRQDLADLDPEAMSYIGYIGGLVDRDPDGLGRAVQRVLPWLGESIARPIDDMLADAGARGVTLIACGPISLAPLAAASWTTDVRSVCLLDRYEIRHASTAVLTATALRRGEPATPQLLVLTDPRRNLNAATAEGAEIARMLAADLVRIEDGDNANRQFLAENLQWATHVHIAGHASGGLLDSSDTLIQVADADLSPDDLRSLGGTAARLITASACQTAISNIAENPDEAISIGTALLMLGATSSIATLWPVDDAATALLMVRAYEEILINGLRPPEGLRRAQLWLRDLDEHGKAIFLAAHPRLQVAFATRAAQGTLPGRRGGTPGGGARPYSHPEFWAPFVAFGV